MGCNNPFVGVGVINVENRVFCVSADTEGNVGLWNVETGEKVGEIVFEERALCMRTLPGIPVVLVGLCSGHVQFVDFSVPNALRLLRSIRFYKKPVRGIFTDQHGDIIVITAKDEKVFLVSGDPGRNFEPLGFIVSHHDVCSVAFSKGRKGLIYAAMVMQNNRTFTNVKFFKITEDILYDPEAHRVVKSHELRSDLIGLITLTVTLPLSGAFLNVIEPPEKVKAEMKDEDGLSLGGLGLPVADEEAEGNEEHSDNESTSSVPPVVTLYSLDQVSHEIAVINLTQVVAEHPSSSAISDYQLTRLVHDYRTINLLTTLAPNLFITTSISGTIKIILITATGVNELLSLHVHQSTGTGVVDAAITPDMGVLVTGGSDGLLCAIPLANKLPKVEDGILGALASNSKGKLKALQELQIYAPVGQSANAHTGSSEENFSNERDGNQSNLNQNAGEDSASKSVPGRSKNTAVGGVRGGPRQIQRQKSVITFEAFLPKDVDEVSEKSESQDPTWLEEERLKQQREDVETLTSTKEQIVAELERLKSAIENMANMNDNLTDLQKVETTEFELDTEEHNAILDQTNLILKNKRKEIMCNDLIKRFTHDIIKKQCWDSHHVKGRSLLAYDFPIQVDNYPLYERNPQQERLLKQAQIRRRVEINLSLFRQKTAEAESLLRKESARDSEASSEDADEEEQKPEEKNLVQTGGTAEKFGVRTDLLYGQLEIFTTDEKILQITLIKDVIYQLMSKFNAVFEEYCEKKRLEIRGISKRVARINQILPELYPDEALISMTKYEFQPVEKPEVILTVTDEEVDVEKYLSPEQIAELERLAALEAERLRLAKLDNWRERGLEDMMGGVLEVRREDELKKDIPKPAFVLAGKPEIEWTEDEKRIYKAYLKAVKELEEEREKYRKFLEADMKKNMAAIDEAKAKFNENMVELFATWLRYEVAILQEVVKIWKLKSSILLDEELRHHELVLQERVVDLQQRLEKLEVVIQEARDVLERVQEECELLAAEDRLMEKAFKKEFPDVHGAVFDLLNKAYKRRPKKIMLAAQIAAENEAEFRYRPSIPSLPATDNHAGNNNPYLEGITLSRGLEMQWAALHRALEDYDEINKMAEYNIDPSLWKRLYAVRLKKVDKEMELKIATHRLEEINEFLKRRQEEAATVAQQLRETEEELHGLNALVYSVTTNMDINIVMSQGQIEVEIPDNKLAHDFNGSLLINCSQVEKLNDQVIALAGEKLQHMNTIKEFKKRFKHLEWALREMLMKYEDLQTRQNDIKNFQITREIQRYLQNEDYDGMVTTEIFNSERAYAQLKKNHERQMEFLRSRIKFYKEKQTEKMRKENNRLTKELSDLNVSVWEARHIYEQIPFAMPDFVRAESCYKSLLHRTHLTKLIKVQEQQLTALREELERLQLRNFPNIADGL
uniref:Cilia- and flagella-associated protein 43 n=1 Tax=Schistocephalus solidus TaxID=70667 RepID=A0A0V0J2R4_SCHSO